MDPPRLERALVELQRAEADVERAQRGVRDIRLRISDLERRFQLERGKLETVFRVHAQSAQDAVLKRDLRAQEVRQVQTKVSLLRLTLRRARQMNDARLLSEAKAMGQDLGIPESQATRYES